MAENQFSAAKRQTLPMVETVFLHKIGTTTLEKCPFPNSFPLHFTKAVVTFLAGIHIPQPHFGLLFFPHKRPKKRAKERCLVSNGFGLQSAVDKINLVNLLCE
ncbi:hypothetical protein [Flavobacterium salmonis]|uniref:hypothetical protein n=1 Tax=Flavobacterium salmonis TaxID=2654844 RepID=UPI0015DDEE66|nr:hypothetical protein [Flavobacterium salmonis]